MKPCRAWLVCGFLALTGCAAPALRSQSPEDFSDVLESKHAIWSVKSRDRSDTPT